MAHKSFHESNYFKTIETVGPNEHVVCVVYQHPFGLIFIYVATLICLCAGLLFATILMPSRSLANSPLLALAAILVILLIGVLLIMATIVYKQTKLTVTDRNIMQIAQKGLLNRKVSQLSLANVEDVTSEQKGVFSNSFDYGTLVIETAGEQANFIFNYCPNPHRVASIILSAKDDFMSKTGMSGSYRNRPYANDAYSGDTNNNDTNDTAAQ